MCGLTGYLDLRRESDADTLRATVRRMSDTILHRGPDDSGEWVDAAAGVALGFRRLAILDLSPEGHQPMVSASGRYVLLYNGEIYNYLDIRAELEAASERIRWRGHSDTEVMLAAFERWGVRQAVERFNGMFGLAAWDRKERTLTLGRDRLGEKPMYYGRFGSYLLFGSELKTLRAHPAFRGEVDRDALALFLRYNYVPAPFSIYQHVRKLPPACLLTISTESGEIGEPTPYWSVREAAEQGTRNLLTCDERQVTDQLEELLQDSVRMRMVADVPLGAFLSGGIDSSTVVALMQAQSSRPVKTFSIGFRESDYSEAEHAKAVALHLGTDHTEMCVTPHEAMEVIPKLPTLYDEPFADVSQIPTHLVSAMARRHVTVGLSGDGGDELFGGYIRHLWGGRVLRRTAWMPRPVRSAAAGALTRVSPRTWNSLFRAASPVLPRKVRQRNVSDKVHKLADALGAANAEALYVSLVSHWKRPTSLVRGSNEPITPATDPAQWASVSAFAEKMMYLDAVTYLPDDVLAKVDRASMGVSLEARVPLLDHRVVEFAWRVPLNMKIRDGQGKWLLRQVLYRHVPRDLVERPKMGFNVPIDAWLRGPLRDWAESLLSEDLMKSDGYLNPAPIRERWSEQLRGRRNWQHALWGVLMFQSWLQQTAP